MKTKYSVYIVNSCNIVLDITALHINYILLNYIAIHFSTQILFWMYPDIFVIGQILEEV